MPTHSIYALCEPDTGAVRYVGRTAYPVNSRLSRHIQEALHSSRNRPVHSWIATLAKQGQRPAIMILEECNPDASRELEAHWIALCIDRGDNILNVLARSGSLQDRSSRPETSSRLLRMPTELADRFDQVVAAKYTTRSALVRELMAREVETFFATRPQVQPHATD